MCRVLMRRGCSEGPQKGRLTAILRGIAGGCPTKFFLSGPVPVRGHAKVSGRRRPGPSGSRKLQKTFRLQGEERALRQQDGSSCRRPPAGRLWQDCGPWALRLEVCLQACGCFRDGPQGQPGAFFSQSLRLGPQGTACVVRHQGIGTSCFQSRRIALLIRFLFLQGTEVAPREPHPQGGRLNLPNAGEPLFLPGKTGTGARCSGGSGLCRAADRDKNRTRPDGQATGSPVGIRRASGVSQIAGHCAPCRAFPVPQARSMPKYWRILQAACLAERTSELVQGRVMRRA